MESHGSEGEYIGKGNNAMPPQDDNATKISLDTILKISQVLIIPLLLSMFYLFNLIGGLERRFVSFEAQLANFPRLDSMIAKIAVMEDRQNRNIQKVDSLEQELIKHRENSTYDPAGINPKYKR
jgi:hypothetical protein